MTSAKTACLIYIVLTGFTTQASHETGTHQATNALNELLAARKYDERIRPNQYRDAADKVEVYFNILAANDININKMAAQMQLDLHLTWSDHRLAHNHTSPLKIDAPSESELWMPDIYIVNALETTLHHITEPNKCVWVHPSGKVERKIRVSVLLRCNIDLRMFPWDVQHCPIIFQSYSYPDEDLRCLWANHLNGNNAFVTGLYKHPMSQYKFIQFQLHDNKVEYNHPDRQGNWSSLTAVLSFQRLNGFYAMAVLVPINIIICLSWMSFLIDAHHAPARVFLGITCILTIFSATQFLNGSLPQVNYMKIIDYYLLIGKMFVVLAMVEYAIVLLLRERISKDLHFKGEGKLPTKDVHFTKLHRFWTNIRLCFHGNPFCRAVRPGTPEMCDKASAYLFPTTYLIFNFIFWTCIQLSPDRTTTTTYTDVFTTQMAT